MSAATEQAPEQAGNLNGSAPLNEVVLDSARVASKDANGLDKSTDNPNPTGNLNNGNNSTVQVPEGYVDGSHGTDRSTKNMSGAGAAQGAQKPKKDPAVGMSFPSEDKAFDFYNAYARRNGFSV